GSGSIGGGSDADRDGGDGRKFFLASGVVVDGRSHAAVADERTAGERCGCGDRTISQAETEGVAGGVVFHDLGVSDERESAGGEKVGAGEGGGVSLLLRVEDSGGGRKAAGSA